MAENFNKTAEYFVLSLPPVSQKITRFFLREKELTLDEIISFTSELNAKELNIRSLLCKRIGNIKFHSFLQPLCRKVSKNIDPQEIITEAYCLLNNYRHNFQENEWMIVNLDLKLFIKLLSPYANLFNQALLLTIDDRHQDITEYFANVFAILSKIILDGKIYDEKRLYLLQTIKHLDFWQNNKLELSKINIPQLWIALNPEFSGELKIFHKQVEILNKTYGASTENSTTQKIKEINYHFISKIFRMGDKPCGALVQFPFLGGWISDETYHLFRDNKAFLDRFNLSDLVFSYLKPLYLELERKLQDGYVMSPSDGNITMLYKIFYPQKNEAR